MLVRIVRMTFRVDAVDSFLEHFDASAPQIRAFPGCRHLELWRDADTPTVCTTYSHWEHQAALDRYRESPLFRSTWNRVKPLFSDRPAAHSYTVARSDSTISNAPSDSSGNGDDVHYEH
ncbi:MAG: antibiotic biosynthesis monooxygenase [Salinibacter sp.]